MNADKAVRVIVAEPVAASRRLLLEILKTDPAIAVVGVAGSWLELVEMAREQKPAAILLKMRPGGIDGVKATHRIMESDPVPIILVTAGTRLTGVAGTLDALAAGALAVLKLPSGAEGPGFAAECRRIVSTIRTLAAVRVIRRMRPAEEAGTEAEAPLQPVQTVTRIVAIATSTGGPAALRRILAGLPGSFPAPILVVQHITEGFAAGLVDWLNAATSLCVKLGQHGEPLKPGDAYLAPDGFQMGASADSRLALSAGPPVGGFRPSASFLFESVAAAFGGAALGVILTGMGEDGVAGLRSLKSAGGYVLAQDEPSSLVFGMPAAAISAGLTDEVVPLEGIAARILRSVVRG